MTDHTGPLPPTFVRVKYSELNAKQKDNFNFQNISAVLADYGYVTFRLSDDWHGADFIAVHNSGDVLRVQLKTRLTFGKKYHGKSLYIAFPDGDAWYLYPHDELLSTFLDTTTIGATTSWQQRGGYSFPYLSPRQVNCSIRTESPVTPARFKGESSQVCYG